MWTTFKAFIECITILLLFYVLFFFWLRSMCDLGSLNRYQTSTPCIGKGSLKNQTASEVPKKLWSILFLTPYPLKPMAL